MRRFVGVGVMLVATALAVTAMAAGTPSSATARQTGVQLNAIQKRLLSGVVDNGLQTAGANALAPPNQGGYTPTGFNGCPYPFGTNVPVNQNCENPTDPDLHGRGQAQNETSLAQDPQRGVAHAQLEQRLPPR